MSKHQTEPEVPRWDTVYLVCKACGKRGSGPKDFKPKAIAAAARQRSKAERPRPRVVFTSCLGLCPKAATAVARVGGGSRALIAAVRSPAAFDASFPVRLALVEADDFTPVT